MYQIKNFTDNDDIRVLDELGPFKVVEYIRDLSVMPSNAMLAYYFDPKQGFAVQCMYTADGSLDEAYRVKQDRIELCEQGWRLLRCLLQRAYGYRAFRRDHLHPSKERRADRQVAYHERKCISLQCKQRK